MTIPKHTMYLTALLLCGIAVPFFASAAEDSHTCYCQYTDLTKHEDVFVSRTSPQWPEEYARVNGKDPEPTQRLCEDLCYDIATSQPNRELKKASYNEIVASREPIIPRLGLPIPGLEFPEPVEVNGVLTINFIGLYLARMYQFLIGIGAVFAMVMIVIGGLQYMLKAGAGEARAAIDRMKNAVIGFVLLLLSYLILYTTNPSLTIFPGLQLQSVARTQLDQLVNTNLRQCADVRNTVTPCDAKVLKKPSGWSDELTTLVNKVAVEEKIDPILLASHLQKETGGTREYTASRRGPCGEIGLAQFMPTTYDTIFPSDSPYKCCTRIARKTGIVDVDKTTCAETVAEWPPPSDKFPNCNASLCSNCQVGRFDCAMALDTSQTGGLEKSVRGSAIFIRRLLANGRVRGDYASAMCAYNGKGAKAAEYAADAGRIYKSFCERSSE